MRTRKGDTLSCAVHLERYGISLSAVESTGYVVRTTVLTTTNLWE